jgi:hypothetical protein
MVLRRVVKVQHTRRVLAFLDQRRIDKGQQITPRHRQRGQQLVFAIRRRDEVLLEVAIFPHRLPDSLGMIDRRGISWHGGRRRQHFESSGCSRGDRAAFDSRLFGCFCPNTKETRQTKQTKTTK